MEYVHVVSNFILKREHINFQLAAINQCNNVLISLIHGFRKKGNVTKNVDKFSDSVKELYDVYKNNIQSFKKLFIDSGGYSFITGDVDFNDTYIAIYGYNKYLKNYNSNFDAIFSLDIPLWGNNPEKFNYENLLKYNCESLITSYKILAENPSLAKKFYFVWQFKLREQFDAWNEIYDELQLIDIVRNRAIGGLVSLKEKTGIDFSPFTEIAMRCFLDHLYSPFSNDPFSLHVLGQNLPYHRFHIQFLDSLFSAHCQNKACITYDSANYTISGLYDVRNLEIYYINEHNNLEREWKLERLPHEVIETIFQSDELFQRFKQYLKEIDNSRAIKLSSPMIGIPLNVFSQLQLDKYFKIIIDNSDIVLKLMNEKPSDFSYSVNSFIHTNRELFNRILGKDAYLTTQNDLQRTYRAYQVIKNKDIGYEEKKRKLNELVIDTIGAINFKKVFIS